MTFEIMNISHYQEVMRLWQESEGLTLRDADSEENIGRYLDRNPTTSFVAFDEDRMVGCILCGNDGRRGFIHHTAVASAYQGKGVGRKLFQLSIDALEKEGIQKSHLFVRNENESAHSFWQSMGFQLRDDIKMYSFINSENSEI